MWMNEIGGALSALGIVVAVAVLMFGLWLIDKKSKQNVLLKEENNRLEAKIIMLTAGELVLANLFAKIYENGGANRELLIQKIREHMKELFKSSSSLIRLAALINELPDSLSAKLIKNEFYSLCHEQEETTWISFYFCSCANNNKQGQAELERIFAQLNKRKRVKIYNEVTRLIQDRLELRVYNNGLNPAEDARLHLESLRLARMAMASN